MIKGFINIMLLMVIVFVTSSINAATLVFSDDFESGNLSKWTVASSGASASKDSPFGGSYCLKVDYRPERNQMVFKDINVGNEIFLRFRVKAANSWPNTMGTKYLRTRNNAAVSNQTEFWLGACNWWINGHTYENDGAGSLKQWNTNRKADVDFGLKGNWVKIEIYMKKNSTGSASDGVFIMWWNGIEVYKNSSFSFWKQLDQWYNRFYFPSNMNCDSAHITECCNGPTDRNGAIMYFDNIEIWSGMPSGAGIGIDEIGIPGGLKVVAPIN